MNPHALILLHNLPRITRTFVNSNHFHRSLGGSSYREYTVFNIYFNDLFFILEETESINYADDTNLYACDMDLSNLIRKLECDAPIAIEWFECNYMKLNNDKCHFIVAGNKHENLWVNVGDIWETASENILGVTIDCNLN